MSLKRGNISLLLPSSTGIVICDDLFKEVSRAFQGSFKEDSRVFQGSFRKISRVFQESFMCVSTMIDRCFKKF